MKARARIGRVTACLLLSAASLATAVLAQTMDDGRRLFREGRTAEAIEVFRQVAESAASTDPVTAGAARNNACVLLTNTGVFDEALVECELALALRRAVGDTTQLARTHNNMGRVLQHLARYREAELQFREALSLNRANDDVQGQVINWSNLGALATQAGRYSLALDAHERVMRLAASHADAGWAAGQVRLARINRAVVLERLGAYREALASYDEVLAEREAIPQWQLGGLLVNRGVVYRNLGDPVRAAAAFEQAIPIYRELGDRAGLSNTWLNIGLVRHLNLRQLRGAEEAYREALRLAEASGDRTEEIQDLYYLGRLLLDAGRAAEAAEVFERCLIESEVAGSGEGRWASLEGLARIARTRGDLRGALDKLAEAATEIERVRDSLPGARLRAGYFGDKRPVFALAIEVLAELARTEVDEDHAARAFEWVQRAKARVLLDALGASAASGQPLTAAAVIEALNDDTLLEYFVADEHLLVWRIRHGTIEMRVVEDPQRTLSRVAEVHAALSKGGAPSDDTGRALSADLLGVFESWPKDVSELRIAPDGRLHYLPFELLEHPGVPATRIIEHMTISYVPSGSALGWLRSTRGDANVGLVGFGDPQVSGDATTTSTTDLWTRRFDLGPLPAAAAELARLDRWLPGEHVVRTGDRATEAEFARVVAGGSRVVHLASHTVVDERQGRGAAILLAPGEGEDGLLHPQEIATLDYPVDLTVLAACRTALGGGEDGNALSTLTGSFLAAGSGAVVATLWDVNDAATGAFMDQFYYELDRGRSPATALRRAKERMIRDPQWGRPDFWSAYVLVGDAGPVAADRGRSLLIVSGVAAALFLLLLVARRLRR